MDNQKTTLIDRLMTADGKAMREARERLGLTQADLAAKAGTNQQTIDRLERGITRLSKFMPEIRAVLGLAPIDHEESLLRFSGRYEAGYGVRANLAEDFRDAERMPVFKLEREGAFWIVDWTPAYFAPRSHPVADQIGAYGVIVPSEDMFPALRPGDVVIVNPDATGEFGAEHVFLHGLEDGRIAMIIRAWFGFEKDAPTAGMKDRMIKVRQWNPPKEELLPQLSWPAMGPVVAKLSKPV